ncbi:hypothetical protein XELAEV_18024890mg [Xenopus laevis]|uniref:Uncharacterized protein n=1 Tax=Xenopus laevis TaxID=8355 RepID=A0A974CYI3_XENLA|nr:hypothetical protein XELAEV_18024890mg [Xenopus laevis]
MGVLLTNVLCLSAAENTNIKHYPLRILDLICGLLGVISIAFLSTYVWSMLRYKKKEEEDVEMQNNPDVLLEAPGEKQTVILIPGACDLTNIVATDINTEEVEENKVNPVATEEPKDKITEPNEELQQKPEQEAELKEQKKKKKWKCFFFKKKSKQRKDKIKSGKKGREDGNGNDTSLNNTSEAYE